MATICSNDLQGLVDAGILEDFGDGVYYLGGFSAEATIDKNDQVVWSNVQWHFPSRPKHKVRGT